MDGEGGSAASEQRSFRAAQLPSTWLFTRYYSPMSDVLGTKKTRAWLGGAALVLACFAVYVPALGGDYLLDDDILLLDNPVFEEDGLYNLWFAPPQRVNYWPVTFTTYWLEHQIWGFDPLGYHVVNVLIHAASAIFVWRVLRRLRIPTPWLVAFVFAVHPLNVESVAWIAQRKNLLSMFFAALSLLFFLRFEERRRLGIYLLALLSFAAAMLSKGAAAPLPAVLLLCAWWQRGQVTRRDVGYALPFFAVTGLLSLVEILTQSLLAGSDVMRSDDFITRLAASGWAWWFYISKALLPVGLCFVYPRWVVDVSTPLTWLPLFFALVSLGAAWWWRHNWGRPALFALIYYGLMLSPVIGFFDIYYMRFSLVADRYQYLALPGLMALVVGGLGSLAASSPRVPRAALAGAAGGVVVACALASGLLAANYRGAEELWRDTLAKNPDAFLAHYNLGHLLQSDGRLEEAAHHYRETLRIRPDDPLATNNLGKVAQDQGRPQLAIQHYRRAIQLDPEFLEAHNNLAVMLAETGESDLALSHYHAALRIDPDSATVHFNLARLLEQLGRFDASLAHYRRVLELDPGTEPARVRAGIARGEAARQRRSSDR